MRLWDETARWHEGDVRLTNAALCVLGLALVVLAHQFVREMDRFQIGFSGVSLLSATVYLAAVLVVRTQPVNRTTLRIVIGFAVAMYAITYLASPDRMSSDIYRYVWDGIVQHAGISPYRYVPGDKALTWLRAPNQDVFDNINRRDYARTIYPPVAQMLYWCATYLAPSVEAMKLFMLGFLALTAWAVTRILQRLGRPASEVLLLLWCPLLVWELGNAGHVDAIVCGFMALALLFRVRERPAWVGFFLGCAAMTKFYPLLLVPALYQRRDWKMPAALAGVVVAGYAAYSSVGWLVFGFLSGYSKEEGLESGSRFFLLDYAHTLPGLGSLPKSAFLLLCAVVLGGLAVWAWRFASVEHVPVVTDRPLPTPAFLRLATLLAWAMMVLFSPHYSWYLMWLVPLMTLAPSLPLFVYVLGFFYAFTTSLADPGPKMFLLNERLYLAFAVSFALHFVLKRWPVWPALMSTRRLAAGTAMVPGGPRLGDAVEVAR